MAAPGPLGSWHMHLPLACTPLFKALTNPCWQISCRVRLHELWWSLLGHGQECFHALVPASGRVEVPN